MPDFDFNRGGLGHPLFRGFKMNKKIYFTASYFHIANSFFVGSVVRPDNQLLAEGDTAAHIMNGDELLGRVCDVWSVEDTTEEVRGTELLEGHK